MKYVFVIGTNSGSALHQRTELRVRCKQLGVWLRSVPSHSKDPHRASRVPPPCVCSHHWRCSARWCWPQRADKRGWKRIASHTRCNCSVNHFFFLLLIVWLNSSLICIVSYFSVMGIEPYQIRFDTWDGYSDSLSVSLLETGAQQGVRWFWEKAPVQKVSMKYDIVVFSEAEVRQLFLERNFTCSMKFWLKLRNLY